jgi:hypothetical protein
MDNVRYGTLKSIILNRNRDTLQFYVDEFKKIRNGINIDGQPIEPWLYFHEPLCHRNTYTDLQQGDKRIDIKGSAATTLRDNRWYIIQDYRQAKIDGKILFIAATRRLFKVLD